MSEEKVSERDLVIKFRDAKDRRDELKAQLASAQAEYDDVERLLIEALVAQDKTDTARYEGIGYCGLRKPKLYARYHKENEEQVFGFLKEQGREDLIKATINSQSLSTYVKELVEEGKPVPPIIEYSLVMDARFYPER